MGLESLKAKAKLAGTIAAGAGVVGAHVAIPVAYHRYHDWKVRRQMHHRGFGIDRRQFARLTHARQTGVLYYRRQQLSDFQGIHRSGYYPRQRRARLGTGVT